MNNLYTEMVRLGYKTIGILNEWQELDKETIESLHCKLCGNPCFYEGFILRNGFFRVDSYRAFALCPHCGHYVEI